MAALVLISSADCLIRSAASTSAFELMILASLSLFCLAAEVRSFYIDGGMMI